ncbi:hypothetical protein SESBI_10803 [Sesbania bispinosa]|nr:hypothetical protein SESBI_10803 [Sesbania bispinosa]
MAKNLVGSGVKVGKFKANGEHQEYTKSELELGSFTIILFFPKPFLSQLSILRKREMLIH